MGIFSREKKDTERVLILDIDSSFIGASVLESSEAGTRDVFSVREPIDMEEGDPERFLAATLRSLKAALGEVFALHMPAPDKIFCLLSSPWYVSEIRKIKMAKNVPFVFTAKLADELLRKEAELLESRYMAEYGNRSGEGMEPIELKTMRTLLNGYAAASPLGKKAKELEVSVYISAAPSDILEKMRSAVNGYFHNPSLKFMSSCFASFSATRDLFSENDYLLVEIGGETTDLSMVKKGELSGFLSFPIGSGFLSRHLARNFGSSRIEAASLVSLHVRGHAERLLGRRMAPALKGAGDAWLSEFERALSDISDDVAAPSSVVVVTDPRYSGFFQRAIGREQSHQYDWSESKFKTVFFSKEALHSLYLRRFV